MVRKRLIGVITVIDNMAVQSFGYNRYLPLGDPGILAENLDRWRADEILVSCIDRIVQYAMKNHTEKRGNIKKSGSEPKLSDASVITLSLTAKCLSIESENYLFKKLTSQYKIEFPDLFDRSRYN